MEKGKGGEKRHAVRPSSPKRSQMEGGSSGSRNDEESFLTLQEDRKEIDKGIERKLSSLHEKERELLSNLYRTEIEKQVLLNARTLIDEKLRKVQHQQYLARAAKVGKNAGRDEDLANE